MAWGAHALSLGGRLIKGNYNIERARFYLEKIRIITDTSSDLSVEEAERYGIELLPVIFQIDGKPCYEGIDLTNESFYELMPEHDKISAGQIPAAVYLDRYERAQRHGYTDVIVITAGSAFLPTAQAAALARSLFFEQHPQAELRIHVANSKTYSIAFGAAVLEAAKKAQSGASCTELLRFLEDWFARVELYITSFSMRYVPVNGALELMRSIAIEITRAFPIIRISQGQVEPLEGAYGAQQTFSKFVEYCRQAISEARSPYYITYAKREQEAKAAAETLEAALGYPPERICQMGASTVYHNGRAAVAVIFQREQPV